jgi:hypothetical protein
MKEYSSDKRRCMAKQIVGGWVDTIMVYMDDKGCIYSATENSRKQQTSLYIFGGGRAMTSYDCWGGCTCGYWGWRGNGPVGEDCLHGSSLDELNELR